MTMNGYVLIIIDEAECNEKRYEKKKDFIWVPMYLARKCYLGTLFLRLLLETGPPFSVFIRATRRSNHLQGKEVPQSFLRRWVFGSRDLPLCSQALYWLVLANPAVVWYEELHCPRPQQCMKWCLYILAYIPHNAVVTPCVCLSAFVYSYFVSEALLQLFCHHIMCVICALIC